ncbi:MAG: succinate dehydrogenase, cytochrome b556 subunit [Burkholderiales bacterium]|jgi:succinate dehydrogenase / fumarate reductase cytochrome b subunit
MSASRLPGETPRAPRRPVYLDLTRIREPVPAIVSILHRISGAALFLVGIPLLLYAVQRSLASPEAYASLLGLLDQPMVKLLLLGLIWAYLHHFCAGIRHLLLDMHIGTELKPARQSGFAVMIISLALTAIVGARLW